MKVLLLLFALVALSHGKGFEFVSKYYGDVRTSIVDPNFYSSQFVIESDLHVKFTDFKTLDFYFEFKNPKVYVSNGNVPVSGTTKPHTYQPFPAEVAKYFTEPFLVRYTKVKDVVEHIYTTTKDEPMWSLNLKRSVASILQFNETIVDDVTQIKEKYTFSIEEPTIYGDCPTHVTMTPYTTPKAAVMEKYFSPSECHDYKEAVYTNLDETPCHHAAHEHKKSHSIVNRFYYIEKSDVVSHFVFNRIVSLSKVAFHPFRAEGDTNFIFVNQTFQLTDIKQIEFTEHEKDFKVDHDIIFEHNDHTEFDILKDLTYYVTETDFPRYKTNLDVCTKGIKTYAENVHDFESLYYLLYKLPFFTFEDLSECYQTLNKKEDTLLVKVFYQLLPNIGSKASTYFMINLFEKEKIKTNIATEMLQSLPFNYRTINKKTLADLKRIITDEYIVKPDVKRTAILAYATMVYKTFQHDQKSEHVKEYVDFYYEHLRTAKTYQDQVIWLQGLRNIQFGDTYKYLIPIVRGDQILATKYDHYLQMHAILALEKFVYWHQTEVYDVLWPIITNKKAELKLRTAAMSIYFKGMHTTSDATRLFWYMQSVTDAHFYNFYATGLKGLAETANHCNTVFETHASNAIKFLKNFGTEASTELFIHESYDETYGIGSRITGGYIGDVKTNAINTFFVSVDSFFAEKLRNLYTFYFTFEGVPTFMSNFMAVIASGNPEAAFKNITILNSGNKNHLELTMISNDRVVYTHNYLTDESGDTELNFGHFTPFFNALKATEMDLEHAMMADTIIPTDIGLPASFSFRAPMITDLTMEHSHSEEQFKVIFKLKSHLQGFYGLKMFSPFSSTWHGIQREFAYGVYLPFAFRLDISKIPAMSFSIYTEDFEDNRYFELYSNVHTISFLEHTTDSEYVGKSTDSEKIYQVTQGPNSVQEYEETETLQDLGIDYKVEIECETHRDQEDLYYSYNQDIWHSEYMSKLGKVSFKKFFNHYNTHVMTYLLSPGLVQCKHTIALAKSEEYPVDKYVLDVNVDVEKSNETNWALETTNFVFNFTFEVEKPTKEDSIEWTGLSKVEYRYGEYFTEVDFRATRYVQNKPYHNFCFNWNKNLDHEEVTGTFNLYYTESYEKECTNDQFWLAVDYKAHKSDEQKTNEFDKFLSYQDCYSTSEYYSFKTPATYPCIAAHTTLREVTYDVTYDNVPSEVDTFFRDFWTFIANTYTAEHDYTQNPEVSYGFHVDLHYPMTSNDVVDVNVKFPEASYYLEKVYYPHTYFFQLENTHFSKFFQMRKYLGQTTKCVLNTENHRYNHGKYFEIELPEHDKFFELVADHLENDWAIYGLHTAESVQFKFMFQNSTGIVTVDKTGDEKKFYYNIEDQMYNHLHFGENFPDAYEMKLFQVKDSVVLIVPEIALYAVYDGDSIKVEFYNKHGYFNGYCIEE